MTGFETFGMAATTFAAMVRAIPESTWEEPGLGEWDVRALVGHASRSLITVSAYLTKPADREDVPSAAEYYARIRDYASNSGAEAIVERGRQAGRDLGEDPAATVDGLLARVLEELASVDDPLIEVIGGLGIRLSNYLPTRVFELAVHGLDIVKATDIDVTLPEPVVAEATMLAADIAAVLGQGPTVLLALTGRGGLPPSFSVV